MSKKIHKYLYEPNIQVSSAAAAREDKKADKYSNLSDKYHFVSVGAQTYGDFGLQGLKLIKQIEIKIREVNGGKLSTFFLLQSISMAIQ